MSTPGYLQYEREVRDSHAKDLESLYKAYLTEAEWRSIHRAVPLPEEARVLEAGCGTGRILKRLANRGTRLIMGVDLSLESLRTAVSQVPPDRIALAQCELTSLPFRSEVFGQVYCLGVLQAYLEPADAVLALKELRRVLKTGGVLTLTTWNYQISDRLKRNRVKSDCRGGINYRKYEMREVYDLLRTSFPGDEIQLWGAVHFHRKPLKVGSLLFPYFRDRLLAVDQALETLFVSRYLAHLVCAHVRKRG